MSRNKVRAVVWLDPADPLQRDVIDSIAAVPPKERHPYILSLLLRGYTFDGDVIYREMLRALTDYQPQFNTQAQREAAHIPENMLGFLLSLQEEGDDAC